MSEKYKNLILLTIVFALLAYVGTKFNIFGAFLAGLYISNGIIHFSYGFFNFGKITPKKILGGERLVHSLWGLSNFVLFAILAYYSNVKANMLIFVAAILITFLLLPIMTKKE